MFRPFNTSLLECPLEKLNFEAFWCIYGFYSLGSGEFRTKPVTLFQEDHQVELASNIARHFVWRVVTSVTCQLANQQPIIEHTFSEEI